MMVKRVYVAHPLRGDVERNIEKVSEICRSLTDVVPFSPIHAFGFMDPKGDQFIAMQRCFALLAMADELWVYGPWWKSEGCQAEISFAGCRGIPIRFKGQEVPIYNGPITDQ